MCLSVLADGKQYQRLRHIDQGWRRAFCQARDHDIPTVFLFGFDKAFAKSGILISQPNIG